ncbi:hypothetical protein [uncultured Methylobacterium sp.]|nr:hypothetical protein [uncultured Methylobacterium sp.]
MNHPYTPPTEQLPPETRTADEILADLIGRETWDLIKPAEPADEA